MNRSSSELSDSVLGAKLREAVALHGQGQLAHARMLYEDILRLQPRHSDALHLLGVIAAVSGDAAKALELIDRALAIDPTNAAAYNNRGGALRELRRWDEALASYDRAAALQANYAEPHYNRGNVLKDTRQWEPALASYDRCIALKADHADAHANRGIVLLELKRYEQALASFDGAIAARRDFAAAHYNRGLALCELRRWDAAIASFDRTLALQSDYADAYVNRGFAQSALERFEAALASWNVAAALKPDLEFIRGQACFTRMRICDWGSLESDRARLTAEIECGRAACSPFTVLAWSGSAELQRRAAETWVRKHSAPNPSPPVVTRYADHDRIRIGYFSADFHEHATSYLIAGLLEVHDRSRFRVIAFSFGPDSNDSMRRRLLAACDDFVEVRHKSDAEVAALARSMQIDIAVDLKGFTEDNRMGIFAQRAAPLQVSYLGYPGTLGASYMDYLVADHALIPDAARRHYIEKIIYLPDSYQINDRSRPIADKRFTKADLGLPTTGFVFCCFNNNFKITPGTFDRWMRILQRVDGSVLWLLEDNPTAARNLRREASRRNVDANRLLFAERVALPAHLARHCAADLFLDTLPYNAHTTASDALWAGLPVLTCTGDAFASRVAASLLGAIRLPELIVATPDQYEDTAVQLAMEPQRLARIRQHLAENRDTAPLFDASLYAKRIEAAYATIYRRHQTGQPPEHIGSESDGD